MRILLLSNIISTQVAKVLGINIDYGGGWISSYIDLLSEVKEYEIAVCCPKLDNKRMLRGEVKAVKFYTFPKNILDPKEYDRSVERYFLNILKDFNPDIVHIFGTEFSHTLAMVKVFCSPTRTVINVQGLVSVCANHYTASLPDRIKKQYTFRDFIRQDNIIRQADKFRIRGGYEIEAIQNVEHVIGRTDWDRACIQLMNPKVNYYKCEEALRDSFYHEKWDFNNCKKNSIFVSQASYPIKGFHLMLEAFAIIIRKYPNAYLYVAGAKITEYVTFKQKIRETSYTKYIKNRMKQLGVLNRVIFLGELDEKKMCQQYLNSHVFVSPSSIENSSNSICEAMQLGVPVVASNVGGISSLLEHAKEGYLYQWDAPYMLAYYVMNIFSNDLIAAEFSDASKRKAEQRHNKDKIKYTMIRIYEKIMSEENK